jgi:hypothetical protein
MPDRIVVVTLKKNVPFMETLALLTLFGQIVIAGQYTGMANLDTVKLGDYTAIRFRVLDSVSNEEQQQIVIYHRSESLLSVRENRVGLVDFCYSYARDLENCFMTDLNADGFMELGVYILPNDDGHGNRLALYTIKGDTVTLDNEFIIGTSAPYFDDLDRDSIPEIIFHDSYFYYLHLATPPLVWKWHDNHYRQANFKFPDYLLPGTRNAWERDELQVSGNRDSFIYSSGNWSTNSHPRALASMMLKYIYAGHTAKADSVLDYYWQEYVPGREIFKNDLWTIILADPYWLEVSQSGW